MFYLYRFEIDSIKEFLAFFCAFADGAASQKLQPRTPASLSHRLKRLPCLRGLHACSPFKLTAPHRRAQPLLPANSSAYRPAYTTAFLPQHQHFVLKLRKLPCNFRPRSSRRPHSPLPPPTPRLQPSYSTNIQRADSCPTAWQPQPGRVCLVSRPAGVA